MKKQVKKPENKTIQATDVVNEIGNLQISIQNTLAGISANITNKLAELEATNNAVADLETRLNELYQIEKEALSLEDMRLAKIEEQERYNKMIFARNEENKESELARNKKWQREEEEHNYDFSQKKKKFLDEFNIEVENQKRAEKIRQFELNQNWNNREAEIKNKETEFADLQKKVADFDNVLKTEVSKAESIIGNTVKKQYEHQIQLLMKDMESERNMSNAKIQSLQIQVGQMVDQIAELNKQLLAARNDAKEVTSQALSSASGRQVVDALQRVVDSKDNNKTK